MLTSLPTSLHSGKDIFELDHNKFLAVDSDLLRTIPAIQDVVPLFQGEFLSIFEGATGNDITFFSLLLG